MQTLTVGNAIDIQAGTLELEEVAVNGGSITSSTGMGSLEFAGYPSTESLTNVDVEADVEIPYQASIAQFSNVQLVDGSHIYLTGGADLNISGISGTGQIVLNGVPDSSGYDSTITGNIAPNITLTTGPYVADYGGYATFTSANNGTILAQTLGQEIQLSGSWSNPSGSIQATGGGIISVASFPGSFGNFSLTGGTLDVETTLTTAQLRTINATSATFSVGFNGTLNNYSDSLSLTGNETLSLFGGTVDGGLIAGTSTDQISVTRWGYFNGVTTAVPVNVQGGAALVSEGLTLNGSTINMIGGSDYVGFYYTTALTGPISGNGRIIFQGNSENQIPTAFTVAPGISVETGTGSGSLTSVINRGAILAITNKEYISISGSLTNTGILEAAFGGSLVVGGISSWTNNGTISLFDGGQITVGNTIFAPNSSLDVGWDNSGGPGILEVSGNLDLSAFPALDGSFPSLIAGPYEIVSYTGSLEGAFDITSPNLLVDYSHPGEIFIDTVPDPTVYASFPTTLGLIALRRRKRTV
jgi:hypothetical protein